VPGSFFHPTNAGPGFLQIGTHLGVFLLQVIRFVCPVARRLTGGPGVIPGLAGMCPRAFEGSTGKRSRSLLGSPSYFPLKLVFKSNPALTIFDSLDTSTGGALSGESRRTFWSTP